MSTLVPHITVHDAKAAIAFYQKAFGAVEQFRLAMPDGRILHAQVKIGDSILMLADEFPEHGGSKSPRGIGGSPVMIHVNVPNVYHTVAQAVAAGATITMPVADMFWGERYGRLRDPFGHEWSVATLVRKLTPEQMQAAAMQALGRQQQQQQQ